MENTRSGSDWLTVDVDINDQSTVNRMIKIGWYELFAIKITLPYDMPAVNYSTK